LAYWWSLEKVVDQNNEIQPSQADLFKGKSKNDQFF